jgi:peptidoglycan/LPS O-acetylase OafA/YrhL
MTNIETKRVFSYDLVRAIAIALVVFVHGEYVIYDHLPSLIANSTIPFGDIGVVVFLY